MIITKLFILLFASALTTRKETTIYYSRITMLALALSSYICYNSLYVVNLNKGIGLYGGIFNVTSITQSFNLFILLISLIILIYNSFYHRILVNRLDKEHDEASHLPTVQSGELSKKSEKFKTTNKLSFVFIMSYITYLSQKVKRYLQNKKDNGIYLGDNKLDIYRITEYPLIILFIITGALFLMSSGDLISIFISIELQSYGLYILTTLHRDSEQATWGGLTYFLLGGLSSCFILLGSALLYINSGTTSMDGIYIISTVTESLNHVQRLTLQGGQDTLLASPYGELSESLKQIPFMYDNYYMNISLIILSVGFLFKVSAAPFHFWSPEVYDAIPTAVTTYVAIVAKISIFVFLLELVYYLGISTRDIYYFSWSDCLLTSSLFSLIIGSILGLTQFRIKRVYAYSTISHVGFILLALCVNTTESIQGYIFYIISYSISNLNAFIILVTIGYTMYLYMEKEQVKHVSNNEIGLVLNKKSQNKKSDNLMGKQREKSYNDIGGKRLAFYNDLNNILLERSFLGKGNNQDNITMFLDHKKYISYAKTFDSLIKNLGLKDINNSPIQLVSQLKGYFYLNSYLSLSLAITLFSFIGIPPLIGFFAKQMVLSAALDSGYIFITLVAILTSVIAAVYYLNIVKQVFFFNTDYMINPFVKWYNFFATLIKDYNNKQNSEANIYGKGENYFYRNKSISNTLKQGGITISSTLSCVISLMTLILLAFIFIPNESFNLAKVLSVLLFN